MKSSPLLAAAAALLLFASGAPAQPRGSERSTMTQIVNGTTLTLDFARPVARGRENLFGGVIHWGETWTPGANWATTLEVVKVNSEDLERANTISFEVLPEVGMRSLSFAKFKA